MVYDEKGELSNNKYINLIKHRSTKLLKRLSEYNKVFCTFLGPVTSTGFGVEGDVGFGQKNWIIEGQETNINDVLMNISFQSKEIDNASKNNFLGSPGSKKTDGSMEGQGNENIFDF